LESSSPAGSHFEAGDPPPLLGEHPPFVVSFALPLAAVILAGMLDFSFALQASVVSPL
jgi:hypothetical protein